jgi:hypothetical protein
MDARIARDHFLSERALRKLVSAALAVAALISGGCSRDALVYAAALPSTSTPATISWSIERGDYVDIALTTAGKELRFLLPLADEACASFRAPAPQGSTLYVNSGLLGRLERADARCAPVGVLSLQEWRDRRPRGSREPIPRSRAQWEVVYSDADVWMLRGRFGLAGELGWVGGADTIAVAERGDVCDAVAASGNASLEFRHVGRDVLTLLGESGPCRLLGIARPLP